MWFKANTRSLISAPFPLELGVGSVRRIWIAEAAQGEVGELAVADIMVVGAEDRDHTPQRRHVGRRAPLLLNDMLAQQVEDAFQ